MPTTGVSSKLMRRRLPIRLLVGALVLALTGANSGASSMCTACCVLVESAGSAAAQAHRPMESQPNISNIRASARARVSQGMQRRHHCSDSMSGNSPRISCPAVASKVGFSNQKADCGTPVAIATLKEGSFSFDAQRETVPSDVIVELAWAFGMADGFRPLLRHNSSPGIRIFNSALTSLRI
jgi:hypothetical protein